MVATVCSLLGYALTGEEMSLPDGDGSANSFLAGLEEAGWPPARVRAHAKAAWDNEQPWPHPLPEHSLDRIGAAQWYAKLAAVRVVLGLDAVRMPPSRRTTLSAEEKRLVAEVPPHHGPVG
ncbi:MAG: hypothetical protein FWF25_00890 [Propionibacteriaceae bacterium]|nr:hypothetical protein [Propionibacteriaceae bacterium]